MNRQIGCLQILTIACVAVMHVLAIKCHKAVGSVKPLTDLITRPMITTDMGQYRETYDRELKTQAAMISDLIKNDATMGLYLSIIEISGLIGFCSGVLAFSAMIKTSTHKEVRPAQSTSGGEGSGRN